MNIVYREELPGQEEFFRLFGTTGWNEEEYHLSPEQLYSAIKHSWHTVAAYDGRELVGFGRAICDGVLHALLVDIIVRRNTRGSISAVPS